MPEQVDFAIEQGVVLGGGGTQALPRSLLQHLNKSRSLITISACDVQGDLAIVAA